MNNDLNEKVSAKYWLRKMINENNGIELSNKILEKDTRIDTITWLSPLQNENNKRLILDTMKETYDELGIKGDFNKWFDTYYQIANRITFMHQLMKKGYKVKVVFLNIVEDYMYNNISKTQWVDEYCKMLNEIIGERFVPRDILIIDLKVHEDK